jgi:precorrin-3B methylase
MTRKLSEPDRQAVDLILDRFATVAREDGVVAIGDVAAEPHVQSVEKILNVLAEMPAQEPPADLVTRALRRIEQTHADVKARQIPPYLGPGQLPA